MRYLSYWPLLIPNKLLNQKTTCEQRKWLMHTEKTMSEKGKLVIKSDDNNIPISE